MIVLIIFIINHSHILLIPCNKNHSFCDRAQYREKCRKHFDLLFADLSVMFNKNVFLHLGRLVLSHSRMKKIFFLFYNFLSVQLGFLLQKGEKRTTFQKALQQ